MNTTLGVIMDPIESIKVQKDSTFAMLLAAQHRGWELLYMEQGDLSLSDGVTYARMRPLRVRDNASNWYQLGDQRQAPLDSLDVVLMRKDPPFDMEYIYTTYLLEQAEHRGCLVVNRPQALRDANEKLFTSEFNNCTPPTLVSRSAAEIRSFLDQHQDIILKPLGGMGGASVFRVRRDDPNTSVIIETLTLHGTQLTMAQQFIPEINAGDKRILMIDGEAVPYALARIPAKGETRGNLAAGGRGEGQPLSERDQWIAAQVGPELKRRGILFAGLDVIGDYLTEINVTSPTCIRELDRQFNLDIAGDLMDRIAERLQ
ncbi:glutathione synthase [endosymbiont of Ridgeia piscesae]|jgi:glutathione synthase|uniref:Glutathione synthetase n=1 Tax=endosymbiont of Ridgeia piscesae TaxID=54398 RepID=A0A0T5Z9M5_9GAMM|nr:glutathione synthase [endosymbiont of Ridgeia piscesae]KRT54789.1 glutathione synthase [endosymbiont of Ridgeia piscesae]KRT59150.1 glutathione synthase [endosymbiont of Ridgeia piscesae]